MPQSWNLFAYVQGRPLIETDPAGLFGFPTFINLRGLHIDETITVVANSEQVTYYTGLIGLNILVAGQCFLGGLNDVSGTLLNGGRRQNGIDKLSWHE